MATATSDDPQKTLEQQRADAEAQLATVKQAQKEQRDADREVLKQQREAELKSATDHRTRCEKDEARQTALLATAKRATHDARLAENKLKSLLGIRVRTKKGEEAPGA